MWRPNVQLSGCASSRRKDPEMLANIEQELHVDAPVERVWQVVTDPAYVAQWFGQRADIDLRPGGAMALGWTDFGDFHGVVERVEPPAESAFRWNRGQGVPVGPDALAAMQELAQR
jgi:uncharacterized protein YndB with AHSA1/START domain